MTAMQSRTHRSSYLIGAIVLAILVSARIEAAEKPRGQMLGPTGISGELVTWPPPPKEFITVTGVEEGGPASGKVKAGAVIVGFGNEKIKGNPQFALGSAVDMAETEEAGGKLTLMLKDGGQAVIQLPVMGSYSPTAPYDCPKTDKIISQTAEAAIKDKNLGKLATRADLLGLMATGEKKYIDVVAKVITEDRLLDIDPQRVEDFLSGAKVDGGAITAGWGWGYALITLGEYHLLTKDESVLPTIRTYALGLARGQDASGCWGHRMMTADSGGRLPGYAQMNQPSLSNFMGMIIARKCGIKDPMLDSAIARTNDYVADHVDKGGFGYGVGGPAREIFNNNGMSGSAAICMSLMGNQHGAKFFSQSAATTYDALTSGHANTFFNPLWTPLGAALSGPEVTQQFFKRSLWFFNGKRHWKGGFPGTEGPAGPHAGSALLTYCLPRKVLLITGREADPSIWVKGDEAIEVILRSKLADAAKSTEALLECMNHPSPQVPANAALVLMERTHLYRRQKKGDDITPVIMAFIEKAPPRPKAKALSCFGPRYQAVFVAPYLERIGAILRDKSEPFEVRLAAASAIGSGNFGEAARAYYNDVLGLMTEERPDKAEKDPFGHVYVHLGNALDGICDQPFAANLVTRKELFYKAASVLLEHKRQKGRAVGIKMLRGMPREDFGYLSDRLMAAIENKDPTFQSYHNVQDTVAPGIEVLAELNIKEGLDILVDTVMGPGKWGFKQKMLYQALPLYGGNAKPYIAKFEEHPNIAKSKDTKLWQDLIKPIEADTNPPKLISVEEAKRAAKAP